MCGKCQAVSLKSNGFWGGSRELKAWKPVTLALDRRAETRIIMGLVDICIHIKSQEDLFNRKSDFREVLFWCLDFCHFWFGWFLFGFFFFKRSACIVEKLSLWKYS